MKPAFQIYKSPRIGSREFVVRPCSVLFQDDKRRTATVEFKHHQMRCVAVVKYDDLASTPELLAEKLADRLNNLPAEKSATEKMAGAGSSETRRAAQV